MWALIIIVSGWGGYGTPRVAVTTLDGFSSREACITAANYLNQQTQRKSDDNILVEARCVQK